MLLKLIALNEDIPFPWGSDRHPPYLPHPNPETIYQTAILKETSLKAYDFLIKIFVTG